MLPILATMLANKFMAKTVGGMFANAQNIFANVCCTMEFCLIWPLCWRTIQLIQVKVAGEKCSNHYCRLLLAQVQLQNGG